MRSLKKLVCLLALLSPAPALASLVIALDLPGLVGRAEHIAVADVTSVRSAWDERHERIETTIELSVVEAWKGAMAPASRLTVIQAGGTVGDLTMVVFGMSQFKPGERSLVFLRGPLTAASVVGMAQGKRLVRRDEPTGRWMVDAADTNGAKLVRPTTSAPAPSVGRTRALDELRAEVRGILKAGR